MTVIHEPGSFISDDGTSIAYTRISTEAEHPPLVISHGSLTDQRDWFMVAERLAAQYAVYVFDRRGRGQSGDNDAYRFSAEIADLDCMMRKAGNDAQLVGHSFGASLAIAWATQSGYPWRLVLYEPPTSHGGQMSRGLLPQLRPLLAANALDDAYQLVAAEIIRTRQEDIDAFRPHLLYKKQCSMLAQFVREAEAIDNFHPSYDELSALRCRTYFLLGELTQRRPLRNSTAALLERIPGATVLPIAGQRHMAHLADPERLARLVARALSME